MQGGLLAQRFNERGHAARGDIADDVDVSIARRPHLVGVDEENGDIGPRGMDEPRSGIDRERGADDDEGVGRTHHFGGSADEGHGFAKPHDEGPQQTPIAGALSGADVEVVGREGDDVARVGEEHAFISSPCR